MRSCGFLVPQCLHAVIYLNPPCSRIIIFNSRAQVLPSRQLEWCSKPFKFSRRAAVVFIFRVRVKSCVIALLNSGVTSLVSLLLKAAVRICFVIKSRNPLMWHIKAPRASKFNLWFTMCPYWSHWLNCVSLLCYLRPKRDEKLPSGCLFRVPMASYKLNKEYLISYDHLRLNSEPLLKETIDIYKICYWFS